MNNNLKDNLRELEIKIDGRAAKLSDSLDRLATAIAETRNLVKKMEEALDLANEINESLYGKAKQVNIIMNTKAALYDEEGRRPERSEGGDP